MRVVIILKRITPKCYSLLVFVCNEKYEIILGDLENEKSNCYQQLQKGLTLGLIPFLFCITLKT